MLKFTKNSNVDAESLMKEYEKRAKDAGVTDVHIVIEMGNPKTLLARTIPDAEEVDRHPRWCNWSQRL